MEIFNLKKLNDVEVKEWYQVKITDRFAALKNFDGGGGSSNDDDDDDDGYNYVDMNRDWESVRENIKASATDSLGYYEFK
jgi:hypothetical protein